VDEIRPAERIIFNSLAIALNIMSGLRKNRLTTEQHDLKSISHARLNDEATESIDPVLVNPSSSSERFETGELKELFSACKISINRLFKASDLVYNATQISHSSAPPLSMKEVTSQALRIEESFPALKKKNPSLPSRLVLANPQWVRRPESKGDPQKGPRVVDQIQSEERSDSSFPVAGPLARGDISGEKSTPNEPLRIPLQTSTFSTPEEDIHSSQKPRYVL
jgi:hypothetical protein